MAQTLAMPLAPSLSVICNARNSNPLSNTLSFPISNPQVKFLFFPPPLCPSFLQFYSLPSFNCLDSTISTSFTSFCFNFMHFLGCGGILNYYYLPFSQHFSLHSSSFTVLHFISIWK